MTWKSRGYLLIVCLCFIIFTAGCAKKSISPGEQYSRAGQDEQRISADDEQQKKSGSEEQDSAEFEDYSADEFAIDSEKLSDRSLEAEEQEDMSKKEKIKQDLSQRIFFDFDSYELKPEAREKLKQKAEILKENSNLNMVIEGHCDERGTEEYNLALGERRARSAYEFLILLGVDSERLEIISYGEERPLNTADNETAWAENRRAEFNVYFN